MAIVQKIRELFVQAEPDPFIQETIVPAAQTTYEVKALTVDQIREVMLLNMRCFRKGENYTKFTFKYLLTEPNILSYRAVTAEGGMAGFIFVIANDESIAHITTIGVAPEHRKRGIARMLLERVEDSLARRDYSTLVLEVRVSNTAAQGLYKSAGYYIVQRLNAYYNNGEDAYLMSKVIR